MNELFRPKKPAATKQQQAIWKAMLKALEGGNHIMVDAKAGTGKTTTAVEGVQRARPVQPKANVGYCAFGVANADDLKKRVKGGTWVGTVHSLCNRVLADRFGSVYDGDKLWNVLDGLTGIVIPSWRRGERAVVRKLVGLAKQYGVNPTHETGDVYKQLDELRQTYGVLTVPGGTAARMLDASYHALKACYRMTDKVDYDDMIWLPHVLDLERASGQFDLLVVDECQDLNAVQRWNAQRYAKRIMAIGDPHQAIFGFRGADFTSMRSFESELRGGNPKRKTCDTLPLTVCWRCGTEIIRLAQGLVPEIEARPGAHEGEVVERPDEDKAISEFEEGQMVLCRTNAPLVRTAYMLWRDKRRAYIQGRKLADPLMRTLKEYTGIYGDNAATLDFQGWLEDYYRETYDKLIRNNASSGAVTELEDRVDCLTTLASQCSTVAALAADIDKLFSDGKDPKTNVRLSSVHRAKGLESDVVWVLEPDLLPHSRATLDWEKDQERNIAYVAATRAIQSLRFVGMVPAIFKRDAE